MSSLYADLIRTDYYGYKPENIVILTDDNNEAARRPTRENIVSLMQSELYVHLK